MEFIQYRYLLLFLFILRKTRIGDTDEINLKSLINEKNKVINVRVVKLKYNKTISE